ncbi:MAG: thioredoxin family protein [Bacteroidales bacterium]|nr:thioredoxin family protein [Bacteroidales bacterium]MCF8333573.1 thioredoxin family protein [Bacteroidales bacterium]
MAVTKSNMLPIGTKAPEFNLYDTVSGKNKTLSELRSDKGTLIMFICNHCPYVKHVNPELVRLANDYKERGISFIAINSNDVKSHPEDSPDKMKKVARDLGYPFPYLYDETQEVAKAYQAACTPDFYLFDGDMKLVYRGRLDESSPGNNKPLDGKDMRNALDKLLQGETIPEDEQVPSMGCNIKWK